MRLQHQGAFTLAVLLAPAAAMAGVVSTIEFTAAEGYVNGQLVGQEGWSGTATQWSVDTSGGGSATITAAGFRSLSRTADSGATLSLTPGQSISFRTVIQLAGSLVNPPAANEEIMRFGIGTTGIGAGSYARLYVTTDGNITLFNSDVQNGVSLPIAANGNSRLAIDTTFNVAATAGSSSTTHELINLDTSTSSGTGTRAGWNSTVYDLVTAGVTDVGSYRQTTWSSANTGITGITMLSTDVVAPVPEPAVLPLAAAAAGLAGIAWRRRRLSVIAAG